MPRGDTLAQCAECRAIIEELMRDLALNPKLKDELRARSEALFGMIGGTEEDLERAEGVLGKFRIGPQQPGFLRTDAFRKMSDHYWRTGHRPFRKEEPL